MTVIQLHHPVQSSRQLARVHLFAGRHLGETELDQMQAYADARLAPLLNSVAPGIVQGLEVKPDIADLHQGDFSVEPGFALAANGELLGLYHPLRTRWQTLIEDYLQQTGVVDATGVYYLMLHRDTAHIDSDAVPPCQRAEFDPSRDSRRVVLGRLSLRRLGITAAATLNTPREQLENWVAADRADATKFLSGLNHSIPLALLAIHPDPETDFRVAWMSPEAGRYEAIRHSGYRVLLNQVSAALSRVMQRAQTEVVDETPAALRQFLTDNLHLDYLPAAGQLPLAWLENPAAVTPAMLWLPEHLGLEMVPVPQGTVLPLIQRHLARRVIDLRFPARDKIRLLLAVDEPNYRPDLLDIPQTDGQMENDIYRYFMRAHTAWSKWHQQFNLLYYWRKQGELENDGETGETSADQVLTDEQIKALGLPDPQPTPVLATAVFNDLISRAQTELQDPQEPTPPYPFVRGVPTPPAAYDNWLVSGAPPNVPQPTDDGLVIQYAIGLVNLEAVENQIRALRTRLEKTRDYLMLQRQQLDSQTVALAALAGGVAGDGAGLQVARWLPFTKMKPVWMPPPTKTDGGSSEPIGEAAPAPEVTAVTAPTNESESNFVFFQPDSAGLFSKGTFNQSLIQLATTTTTDVPTAIRNKPTTASAFELNLNQSRLNLLSKVPKQTLTRPAFQPKEYRFGVMDHINPEVNEYAKAYRAMAELYSTLDGLFDASEAKSIKAKLRGVGTLKTPEEVESLPPDTGDSATDKQNLVQARYTALFEAGQILTRQIALIEARYNGLETRLERKMRDHVSLQGQLRKLNALIKSARETLESLDAVRVEQLGDYGVAQRLLEEDWYNIHQQNKERTRILTTGVLGLYYVRVRPTPISTPLADPLALRYGTAEDIVPGCDWQTDVDLPQELAPFFEAVGEIPMNDWTALSGLTANVPPPTHFEAIHRVRQTRFQSRSLSIHPSAPGNTLHARLVGLHQQNQILLQHWSAARLPRFDSSWQKTQSKAAQVLSLEDIAASANGRLRKPGFVLREKLEHCQYCLIEKLRELPPSVRLQWAQLAEDDHLRVEKVAWWPGLEKAERDDFQTTRTVAELTAWWFRQLTATAATNSRSAMRNMIRASLIYAASGDPAEIIRGNVQVPPRVAAVGERLQVTLNRTPAPGTQLQLIDPQQRVVAMLAVEDHDAKQRTQVQIVKLVQPNTRINTRFAVVANRRTAQLGRSSS